MTDANAVRYFQDKLAYETSAREVVAAVKAGDKMTIVDVRRAEAYNKGHIVDALNPVSYTHLDVYKRQLVGHGVDGGQRALDSVCWQPNAAAARDRLDLADDGHERVAQLRPCLLYTSRCV